MNALEHRIPPPLLFAGAAIAMWLLSRQAPTVIAQGEWSSLLIVLLVGFGLAMGGPAMRAFRRAGTTIDPVAIHEASRLVTSGVYRISRNPMYVGLTALLAAWALQLGTIAAAAGPVLVIAIVTRLQIMPEERFLATRFGAAYRDYCTSVRRWL